MKIYRARNMIMLLSSLKKESDIKYEKLLIDELIENLNIYIQHYHFLVTGVICDPNDSVKNKVISQIIKIHRRSLSANFRPIWEKVT